MWIAPDDIKARLEKIFMRKPIIVAHRGYPIKYKENTLESFLAAKNLGADMIEIDIRMSSDGYIVAFHDQEICGRRIWETKYSQLKALGIELVEDIIEALPRDTLYMLDIKEERSIVGLEKIIREKDLEDRVVLAGMPRAVKALGKKLSLIMAPSFELCDWAETFRRVIAMGAHVLNDHYSCYDPLTHRRAMKIGIKVSTWTIDSPSDIEHMARLGVDAIVTNNLEEALKIVRRIRQNR